MEKIFNIEIEKLKKDKAYYTAKEIHQQPELWKKTLKILEGRKEEIKAYIEEIKQTPGTKVILTGAGTSAYVGDTIASYLSNKSNLEIEAIATTDIVSSPSTYFNTDKPIVLVSFARSGNSPESLATYNLAEKLAKNLKQIVITCNKDGELCKKCSEKKDNLLLLMPEESNDKSFAMTSSFSCMLLACLLVFDIENFESNTLIVENVIKRGENILNTKVNDVLELVNKGYERVVYLGSDSLKGLAREATLKILELTSGKIVATCESTLGFRHGPKSIINDKTVVFVFISSDEYKRKYDLDILKEVFNDNGNQKAIAITQNNDDELQSLCHKTLCTSSSGTNIVDAYSALDYVLYAQLFALFYSMKLGVCPDNPRPDGTVNRVVQGVTIYEYVK